MMIKTTLFSLVLFICAFSLNAQNLSQNISKTTVNFKIKNLGLNVDGHFSDIKIESNFNINALNDSYLNATIKVSSIDTGNKTRNKSLSEKDYFDSNTYPEIQLKSTSIKKKTESTYLLTAQLTIKNTTKTVTIPLQLSENGSSVTLTSYFELNRRDYNVGKKSWVMSDIVKINVVYIATRS
ncbi:YceI family protein [Aquimarina sp. 2201CG1-2-11]|uniref:YceI family protein n=1 Tax=Aquimarina discodermiae TaxID=3231043 RepID=UPI0034629874